MKPPTFLALLFALAFFAAPPRAAAQEVSPEEVIKVNIDLVVMDAQVIAKKDRKVLGDLKREDFEVYEDGARREISLFGRDELPLSVVLLLDVSRSVRPIVHTIAEGALNALARLRPEDEVAVMTFAEKSNLVQGFTRDRKLTAAKIEEASGDVSVGNGTFLSEALRTAARETLKATNPASRRAVIVVTDNIAVTGGKREVERTTDELLEDGAVVYGLIVRSGLGKTINVMTFGQIKAVDTYSEPTGGEVFGASKKEVDEKLGDLFARLRTRYSLGFKTPNTTEDGRLRRLRLDLTQQAAARYGKVFVRTKEGYYFRRRAPNDPARTQRSSDQSGDAQGRQRRVESTPPPPR